MEISADHDFTLEKSQDKPKQNEDLCHRGTEPMPTPGPRAAISLSTLYWVILCSSLLLSEMQAALDSTITANLQPTIINDLGEISKFPWINVTYSLGLGGSCLLWGRIYAFFDSRNALLVARALFAIGCALTAAAPSMNAFIVGKAIVGIGSSGTYMGIINIISTLTKAEEKGRYFGYIGFVWGFGTIIGPVIGGAFAATDAGWRWSFYFNLFLVGLTFPVFLFILPSSKNPFLRTSSWARARRLDLVGSLLFSGALTSGIMALSFAGAVYTWSSGPIIALFCSSGTLWIVFTIQQATATFTTRQDRVLPIHILLSTEMWLLVMQVGCPVSTMFMTIYYVPLYFQFIQGETAIRSAVDLLPFLFTAVAAMLISGRLISNFGYYKVWFIAGSTLVLIMSVCLYTTEVATPHGKIYTYLVLGGVGTGLYAMNSGPVMSSIVSREDITNAGTIFGCADTISSTISIGVANSMFINRATDSIQTILPRTPRAIVQDAIAGVGASLTNQLPLAQKQAVLQAILNAIKDVWIQMIATASLSFVLSFLLRNEKLRHRSKS